MAVGMHTMLCAGRAQSTQLLLFLRRKPQEMQARQDKTSTDKTYPKPQATLNPPHPLTNPKPPAPPHLACSPLP